MSERASESHAPNNGLSSFSVNIAFSVHLAGLCHRFNAFLVGSSQGEDFFRFLNILGFFKCFGLFELTHSLARSLTRSLLAH